MSFEVLFDLKMILMKKLNQSDFTPNRADHSKPLSQKEKLLLAYSNWLRMRNYSTQTYKAYMGTIRMFWKYCEERKKNPDFDKSNAVQTYLSYRMHEQKRDFSTVNGDYSALQWFYKYILNREWNVKKLIRPKKEKRLPRYITPQQFADLLTGTTSKKHQLIMLVFYATGLRLSEARHLKWEHIHFEEGIIFVVSGKGAKDRIAILPADLSEQLQSYRKILRPNQVYVFEGKTMGKAIAPKTVQWAFKRAREKARLPDWVTAHVLRHSYATACLKNGTNLLSLQTLLGHKKLSTTTRYLHLNVSFLKQSYNPLSQPCVHQHLQSPLLAPPNLPNQEEQDNIPSDKSSDNSEKNTSSDTNPITEDEPS